MSERETREIYGNMLWFMHTIGISSSDMKIDKQVMHVAGLKLGLQQWHILRVTAKRILSYKWKVRDNIINVYKYIYIVYASIIYIEITNKKASSFWYLLTVSSSYPALSSLHALPWRICWKSRIRELRASRVQFRTFLRRPIRLESPDKKPCQPESLLRNDSPMIIYHIDIYWHCYWIL